jgi:glycosyltransferase involved in cell wall biosynthesis
MKNFFRPFSLTTWEYFMTKHKICLVGPSKLFISGISYYTLSLSNALSKENEVSVLQLRRLLPGFLFPGRQRIGERISDVDFLPKINVYEGMDFNSPFSWIKASNFIKKYKPSHVICQWWTSSVAHMEFIILFFTKIQGESKIIMEMHEVVDPLEEASPVLRTYSKLFGRIIRKWVDIFITHSKSDRELVIERYNIDSEKVKVLPHGLYEHYKKIDKESARDILGIQEERVILYFGLIRPYKGVRYLIEAFNNLPMEIVRDTRLLIVGELWEDAKNIEDLVKNSKYKEKITPVFQYVKDEEVSHYFSACDVVVLPYTRASQSGVATVAMYFGKPLVASNVGGLTESLDTYPGTFFVPPSNSEAISEALIKANGLGDKTFTPPNIGWEEIAKRYTELLDAL